MVTRPLSPKISALPDTVTETGAVPGLTTRIKMVALPPGVITVGSGGTETASGRGPPPGFGAATAAIEPEATMRNAAASAPTTRLACAPAPLTRGITRRILLRCSSG